MQSFKCRTKNQFAAVANQYLHEYVNSEEFLKQAQLEPLSANTYIYFEQFHAPVSHLALIVYFY